MSCSRNCRIVVPCSYYVWIVLSCARSCNSEWVFMMFVRGVCYTPSCIFFIFLPKYYAKDFSILYFGEKIFDSQESNKYPTFYGIHPSPQGMNHPGYGRALASSWLFFLITQYIFLLIKSPQVSRCQREHRLPLKSQSC
jgi:hypothetical protein